MRAVLYLFTALTLNIGLPNMSILKLAMKPICEPNVRDKTARTLHPSSAASLNSKNQ
jgi:hypothetical protein